MSPNSNSSVRVAVRVRPMTSQETDHYRDQNPFIDFIPNEPQIVVGKKQSFTFDHVYPPLTEQEKVYETCVLPLVYKFLEGYNATVLAYGQTGAGKSFSMGIGLDSFIEKSNEGIVPRFIYTMFDQLSQKQSNNKNNNNNDDHHQISVSFLELHNEDLVDLLSPSVHTMKKENQPMVVIREDASGAICWSGIREEVVTSPQQLLCLLEKGSVARTTAATDMNISSSRSHAIFSIQLRQTLSNDQGQTKTITSKFHFVDLAGSERLKRTNAVGSRAKEGISINSGLLALGNVISALGDESRRVSHIPYRDSKLTRLLQDSLGGNSQTLMLACVSPAWSNHKETINTLKYANRARNIRNRVVINSQVDENQQHNQSGEHVKKLKSQILKLRQEIADNDEFMHAVNDEMDGLKTQVESLKETINSLVQELAKARYQCDNQKQIDQRQFQEQPHDHSHIDTPSHDLAQEYAYTIEELKVQVALLQQEKQQQKQILPPSPPPQQKHQPAPMMTQALSKHSQHGKDSSLSDRKKKRHSYRFGSKKIQRSFNSIRKRHSTAANHHPSRPTPLQLEVPSSKQQNINRDEWKNRIHQHKCDVDNELAFVESKKSAILGDPYWLKESFNDLISFSSAFHHDTTFHITDSKNGNGVPTSQPSCTELAQILQRFGDSLERQRKFVYSVGSLPVTPGATTSNDQAKLEATLRKQHKKELDDMKRHHDLETKKQQHEHQTLKRHYQQLMISSERARTQHNATILTLKQKLEVITRDKKKLMKKSKQDADRARDRGRQLEKQVQKLERQDIKSTHVKKRLERDLHTQKQINKHAKEDIATLGAQLLSVGLMIQKVLQAHNNNSKKKSKKIGSNNKMVASASLLSSDRALLAKAVACARVRGYLVAQKHGVGTNRRGAVKAASLQQRVVQKRQLIRKAISLYVQAYVPLQIHEQLEQKRDRLQMEQQAILAEHDALINDPEEMTLEGVNQRMNVVTAEYHQVCNQIKRLQHQQQKRMISGKAFRDHGSISSNSISSSCGDHDDDNDSSDSNSSDDTWMDDIPFWNTEDAEVAYENVLTLVRTLEPEETRSILETLVHDVIRLETNTQQQCYIMTQNAESTLVSLENELQWPGQYHKQQHQQQQDPFIITPTSTTTSTSSKTSSTVIPRPSNSSAIRRSGLPIPRRGS